MTRIKNKNSQKFYPIIQISTNGIYLIIQILINAMLTLEYVVNRYRTQLTLTHASLVQHVKTRGQSRISRSRVWELLKDVR